MQAMQITVQSDRHADQFTINQMMMSEGAAIALYNMQQDKKRVTDDHFLQLISRKDAYCQDLYSRKGFTAASVTYSENDHLPIDAVCLTLGYWENPIHPLTGKNIWDTERNIPYAAEYKRGGNQITFTYHSDNSYSASSPKGKDGQMLIDPATGLEYPCRLLYTVNERLPEAVYRPHQGKIETEYDDTTRYLDSVKVYNAYMNNQKKGKSTIFAELERMTSGIKIQTNYQP